MKIKSLKKTIFMIFRFSLIIIFLHILTEFSFASSVPSFVRLDPIEQQVNNPTAVALDGSGRIYVVDSRGNKINIFSQSGKYTQTLTGLSTPISVAVDQSGRILVGNALDGNVAVYGPDLNFLFKLGAGDGEFAIPSDIAIGPSGKIHVADKENNTVRTYSADGAFSAFIGASGNENGRFHHPTSIAIDTAAQELVILDHQQIYDRLTHTMMDGARIQFFSLDGTFKRGYSKFGYKTDVGELVKPVQVTVDNVSRVYVTDSRIQKVMIYDYQGNFLGPLDNAADPLRTPMDITIGSTNRLYIASLLSGRVEVYGIDQYSVMDVTPTEFVFTAIEGEMNPLPQTVTISNNGTALFNWTTGTVSPWIHLTTTSGALDAFAEQSLTLIVNIGGLAPGQYTGAADITSDTGVSERIHVALTILHNPLQVTPDSLTFESTVGSTPPSQSLSITGPGNLTWTAEINQTWISLSRTTGAASDTLRVYADITALTAGTYCGTIVIAKEGSNITPQSIPVTLTLSKQIVSPDDPPSDNPKHRGKTKKNKKWTITVAMPGTSLNSIWRAEKNNIFIVGDNGSILHYDCHDWNIMESGPYETNNLYGVWGSSESDLYAVGDKGLVLHYDGSLWAPITSVTDESLKDICGFSEVDIFSVGKNGSILSDALTISSKMDVALRGIWGSSKSDIFVVGESGTILHYDGIDWNIMDSGVTEWLNGIWGRSSTDIFAVGENGTIIHYDGTEWSPMNSETREALYGIHGNAKTDVIAVGANGVILYYDGTVWNTVSLDITTSLNDVWLTEKSKVFITGANGTILTIRKKKFQSFRNKHPR